MARSAPSSVWALLPAGVEVSRALRGVTKSQVPRWSQRDQPGRDWASLSCRDGHPSPCVPLRLPPTNGKQTRLNPDRVHGEMSSLEN